MLIDKNEKVIKNYKKDGMLFKYCIKDINNVTLVVLISKKNKRIMDRNGWTYFIINTQNKHEGNFCIENSTNITIKFVPSTLNQTRIYLIPSSNEKLIKILSKKYRRHNC